MKKLFTTQEFDNCRGKDLLPLQCYYCDKTYLQSKGRIKQFIKHGGGEFCSRNCAGKYKYSLDKDNHSFNKFRNRTSREVKCFLCNKEIIRTEGQMKLTDRSFCSPRCCALYYKPTLKVKKRSKLEIFLEKNLKDIFKDLDIKFNDRKTIIINDINYEIDIYIKEYNLGIEVNGLNHYEPIYGKEKFEKRIKNDLLKRNFCVKNGIKLVEIDISNYKSHFNEVQGTEVLNKILTIIQEYV